MSAQTDEKLIDSALAGDTEAFSVLTTKYYQQVYARLSARTDNPCDKQDIAQEAFLIAWRRLAQLKDKRNFAAWLCRIADNLVKTWYRRQCIQLQFEDTFERVDQQKVHDNRNEDDLIIKAQLRSAYGALSEPHKKVIRHYYFNNRSYEETAAILNINVDSVRSRLQKARIKLRKEMKHMTTKTTNRNVFELNGDDLKTLRSVAALCGTDRPDLPVLAGVLLEAHGRIVATDGRAMAARKSDRLVDLEENVIIGDCLKISEASHATLVLGVDEAVLRVKGKEEVFPVIHGQYPKYEQVLPKTWHNKIRIKSADFNRLVDEIKPHLEPRHPALSGFKYTPVVELCINPLNLELSVTTEKNMGYGRLDPKSKSKIPSDQSLDWRYGSAIKLTTKNKKSLMETPAMLFNFNYLSNTVRGLCLKPDEMLEFRTADPDTMPLGIFSASDPEQWAVVMPMRR